MSYELTCNLQVVINYWLVAVGTIVQECDARKAI